jgi:tetratricopeptide (TPR) repeat protein
VSIGARLRQAQQGADDTETLSDLARDALAEGEEERALPLVFAAAQKRSDPLLWQWAGLLNRALDEHAMAIKCFSVAASLAPANAKIAHGHAQVALEAGLDATALYEQARVLAPADPGVLMGLTAARMAAGQSQIAVSELEAILEQAPLWIEGHLQLAQLRSLLGQQSAIFASLDRAIAKHPREASLWLARCDLHLRQEAYGLLLATASHAQAAGAPVAAVAFYRAVAAGELGDPSADELLSDEAATANPALAIWRIRHLLRQGRAVIALPLIDQELGSDRRLAAWPYAAAAWHIAGDARSHWLEDQPGLVSIMDIGADLVPIAQLADKLRALHERSGQYLDQSVRGGSQTDGPLLSRIDPEIRTLRAAVVGAVERYVAQLPPTDAEHPLLASPRDRRVRFSGSWSVRLRGGGRHANHVHPQGWISSALYIVLPERRDGEPSDSGCLVLGEPQAEMSVDLPPHTKIEPRVGRLVLFPSWMWHGTRPFAEGERLTVAFDVALPP